MYKKIIFLVLFIVFILNLGYRIFQYKNEYLTPYNAKYWQKRYLQSQWVDPQSKVSIGDDGLYAYAAWEYIHGKDPTLLNAEMPFLGKYLLGISILIFNNQNIFALIAGLGVLPVFYLFNLSFFKDKMLAFVPVFLFSFEPLFYEQLRAPFFDLLQLLFIFLIFIFVNKKKYWLSSIFLGCFAATKFPYLAVLPAITIIMSLFFSKKRREIYKYAITIPIAFFVYFLTYSQFFLLGHSFIDFLKIQKWIINFYSIGAKAPFIGTVFPLIYSGTWYTHFGEILKVDEWSITWRIIFILSLISLIPLKTYKNRSTVLVLLFLWVIFYLIFLTVTPIFPRYLLMLLPFLYNLSVWLISKSIPKKLPLH